MYLLICTCIHAKINSWFHGKLISWEVDLKGVDPVGSWSIGSWFSRSWSHESWSRGRTPTGVGDYYCPGYTAYLWLVLEWDVSNFQQAKEPLQLYSVFSGMTAWGSFLSLRWRTSSTPTTRWQRAVFVTVFMISQAEGSLNKRWNFSHVQGHCLLHVSYSSETFSKVHVIVSL